MDVFVYGTLTDPDRVETVLEDHEGTLAAEATVRGLHRVDGAYPTLAPGGSVEGRILRTDARGLERLDEYERVGSGLYVRVSVPRTDGTGTVETYVGDPDRLDAPVSWPGEGSFRERVLQFVRETEPSVVGE